VTPAEALATGLWPRLRLLALTMEREDRFVAGPEETGAVSGPSGVGRCAGRAAEELVLRSLRVGTDSVNFSILVELSKEVTTSFADLMRTTGLDRLTLGERVNDLIQVGLATKDVETRSVSGTPAAAGLLDLVDRTKAYLVESMGAEMPGWKNGVQGARSS
jgi:DNA-binding HxlR family transcriptional regulator